MRPIILAFCLLMFGCSQGVTIQEEDGITVVRNPKNPVSVPSAPSALSLEEDLRIGVLEGEDEYMFGFLRSVQVDDDENIYVCDAEFIKIRVYDRNGRHLRSFGKEGEGPGEFAWPSRMYLRPINRDLGILDGNNNRFCYYSLEGACLKEINLGRYSAIFRAWPDSRGYTYGDIWDLEEGFSISKLVKFDPKFESPVATIAELREKVALGEFNPISYRILCRVQPDDSVIWAKNLEYCFHVLNAEGDLTRKISKDYDPVTIPQAEKKRIEEEWAREGRSSNLVFPEKYPPMYYFVSDDTGKIYVRTYEKDERGLFKWEVFDEEGRYVLDFFHPEEDLIFTIKNNKLYSMNQDNEEGNPHIRRYSLNWQMR
jgi:hypothetical protein